MSISVVAVAVAAAATPEAAFDRYRTEINSHDFERLAATVFTADVVFVFRDGVHRGQAEAQAAFNAAWSSLPDEVYTMEEPEWLLVGEEAAVVVFRYTYRGTTGGGLSLSGSGRGTNLYVRSSDGWRLSYEHLSHDPQPGMPD